eukprot:m.195230 g.195230  ORF g.195230 m.195230 type:complete len:213 (-) comp19433_c0_seq1:13-651(-)
MASRPPTSAKPHAHGQGGNRPKSNGIPLTVATVRHGQSEELTINLDCRLIDLHLVLSDLIGGNPVDLITDKGQVMDLQGMLFGESEGKDAEGDDVRSTDVLKAKGTYYLLKCLNPDLDTLITAGKKHAKAGTKKGPPPLPDDIALWKLLYGVAHDKLNNDLVLKHSNGSPIPLSLPSGLKERWQAKMAAYNDENSTEATSRSTLRSGKKSKQ